jgi:hypothetical protein
MDRESLDTVRKSRGMMGSMLGKNMLHGEMNIDVIIPIFENIK